MQPELIVLDEPTSMLDPSGRMAVMQTLDELHNAGITLIHITHSMEEALKAQRMIVMDQGRIVLDDTPLFFRSMRKNCWNGAWSCRC